MDIKRLVGQNIAKFRKERGLSQEELAFETDLHRTYISGIERGIRNPTIVNVQKIAEALKCDASDLLK
mgnify:CR=1